MSRPLWGRGELALINRLPPNLAIYPPTTVQLTRTNHARPYNTASELPLSGTLTGATSPQRERLIL